MKWGESQTKWGQGTDKWGQLLSSNSIPFVRKSVDTLELPGNPSLAASNIDTFERKGVPTMSAPSKQIFKR